MRLVDTDILIDHFHGVNAATEFVAQCLLDDGELLISIVSVTEILAGMRQEEQEQTEELLALFTIVAADETIARIAGSYLNQFKARAMDLGDALIAATAKQFNAELVTRNERHYPMQDISIHVPYMRGRKRT